jgi:hypothetical protein
MCGETPLLAAGGNPGHRLIVDALKRWCVTIKTTAPVPEPQKPRKRSSPDGASGCSRRMRPRPLSARAPGSGPLAEVMFQVELGEIFLTSKLQHPRRRSRRG